MKYINKFWVLSVMAALFVSIVANGCKKEDEPEPEETNNNTNVTPPPPGNDDTVLVIPTGWSKVGDINANNMIWGLASDHIGNIYAAGYFTKAGDYRYVAKWDGTNWTEAGNLNANGDIYAMTSDVSGNIYVTGDFSDGVTSDGGNKYVAKWNGSSWSNIGGGGSTFLSADGAGNIYKGLTLWNGSSWQNLCPACSLGMMTVSAVAANVDGSIKYVAGEKHTNGFRYVAKCDTSGCFTEVGSINANDDIHALAVDTAGNVYAGGKFTDGTLSSTGNLYVAKWNGTTWSKLGNFTGKGTIEYLIVDTKNGYLYASGYLLNSAGKVFIAKWDGTSWTEIGDMGVSPTVMHVDANGKLYSITSSTNGKVFCVISKD